MTEVPFILDAVPLPPLPALLKFVEFSPTLDEPPPPPPPLGNVDELLELPPA